MFPASLGPGSALGEKGEKNRRRRKKKNGQQSEPGGSLGGGGGGRVTEPGDMPLMPPIRNPAINLSLKCEYVKFSSRMSA